VRRFQQDYAHIFCMSDQIKSEMASGWLFGLLGFLETCLLRVRVHLPAEAVHQAWEVLVVRMPWKLNPGDGAFYGSKIDIMLQDSLKRQHRHHPAGLPAAHQVQPELHWWEGGEAEAAPSAVMIHRAFLGWWCPHRKLWRKVAILALTQPSHAGPFNNYAK
jgi:threonyl-tRNA synthetase